MKNTNDVMTRSMRQCSFAQAQRVLRTALTALGVDADLIVLDKPGRQVLAVRTGAENIVLFLRSTAPDGLPQYIVAEFVDGREQTALYIPCVTPAAVMFARVVRYAVR